MLNRISILNLNIFEAHENEGDKIPTSETPSNSETTTDAET
jgi:hypothetical protein